MIEVLDGIAMESPRPKQPNAIVFDAETTGTDEPEIIQAAWAFVDLETSPDDWDIESHKFRPSKPIELGAIATHHILPSDLTNCPPSSEFRLPDCEYVIGFNVGYDCHAAGRPDIKQIDLRAIARVLYPGLDSYKQSAIYYHLFGLNERSRMALAFAHNAAIDVINCCELLDVMLRDSPVFGLESFWLYSEDCKKVNQ